MTRHLIAAILIALMLAFIWFSFHRTGAVGDPLVEVEQSK